MLTKLLLLIIIVNKILVPLYLNYVCLILCLNLFNQLNLVVENDLNLLDLRLFVPKVNKLFLLFCFSWADIHNLGCLKLIKKSSL